MTSHGLGLWELHRSQEAPFGRATTLAGLGKWTDHWSWTARPARAANFIFVSVLSGLLVVFLRVFLPISAHCCHLLIILDGLFGRKHWLRTIFTAMWNTLKAKNYKELLLSAMVCNQKVIQLVLVGLDRKETCIKFIAQKNQLLVVNYYSVWNSKSFITAREGRGSHSKHLMV